MTAVPAGWAPRTITIYCHGKDLKGDYGHEHQEVELAALVSYEWQASEWWDADERAERPTSIERPDAAPGRPDIARMLSEAAVWWEIACPSCRRSAQSGDALGTGYRTSAQLLAEHRTGITSAAKHELQVPKHEQLSALADDGVSRLPLSALRRILDGR